MKLYTKRGDDGRTDLIGGVRVIKSSPRVEAYGCIDELNATIGVCVVSCDTDAIRGPLITIQASLFDLGAQLATAPSDKTDSARIGSREIAQLEAWIDGAEVQTGPLTSFILPGGTELSARLHQARTVCRRAERRVIALAQQEPVDAEAVIYLNRLADLLFAQARLANASAGVPDVPWRPGVG